MDTAELNFWYSKPQGEIPVEFEYPAAELLDERLKDFFIQKFGAAIDGNDVSWLSGLLTDFLTNNQDRPAGNAEYRLLARCFMNILCAIDNEISYSSQPDRKWKEITEDLGLSFESYALKQH